MIKAIKIFVIIALALFAVLGFTSTSAVGAEVCEDQHYSWTGGPIDEGVVPPIPPQGSWQANTSQEPHKNNPNVTWVDDSLHYTGKPGNANWFYFAKCPDEPSPTPTQTTASPTPTETKSESPTPTPTITTATPTATQSSSTPTPSVSATTESPTPTPTQTEESKSPDNVESTSPSPTTTVIDEESVISTPVETVEPEPTPTITESSQDELAATGWNDTTPWMLIAAGLLSLMGLTISVIAKKH